MCSSSARQLYSVEHCTSVKKQHRSTLGVWFLAIFESILQLLQDPLLDSRQLTFHLEIVLGVSDDE